MSPAASVRMFAFLLRTAYTDAAVRKAEPEGAVPETEPRRHILERRLFEARAVLTFEWLWPLIVAAGVLVAVFLAVSWLGVWVALPHAARIAGVGLFAAAFVAVLVQGFRTRRPERRDALARLDRDSGDRHHPVSASQDSLANAGTDPVTQALWDLHRRRLETALSRVEVAAPSPRLVDRDRYALRAAAVLALAAAAFVAGPDRYGRVAAAFDWQGSGIAGQGFRLDSWIDPPAYTGRPPVLLSARSTPVTGQPGPGQTDTGQPGTGQPAGQPGIEGSASGETATNRSDRPKTISAPINSVVVVRSAGEGLVDITTEGAIRPVQPAAGAGSGKTDGGPSRPASTVAAVSQTGAGSAATSAKAAEAEHRFTLAGDGRVTVSRDGTPIARYDIRAIPDLPPTIALVGQPARNVRGSLTLRYTVGDDYGVIAAAAEFAEPVVGGKPVTGRTLVDPPKLALMLPAAPRGLGQGETTADLGDSPWAGATVSMVLSAKDEGGNTGRSAPVSVVLPARSFADPLARALVEQRRDLVLDPDHHDRLDTALDALTLAPDLFDMPPAVYLGLRTAKMRLDNAKGDPDLVAVADLLWAMALQIEDGDLSQTERDLRAIQQQLKDALARNAPPEEIKKLTDALRQQLDKFLAEMAQKADPSAKNDQPSDRPTRTITPQQLQAMLDRLEKSARSGDMAEAQRALDQLRNILENLKTAKRRSSQQNQASRQRQKSMGALDRMMRDQQALRDQTFQHGRQDQKSARNPDQDSDDADPSQGGDPQNGQQGGQPQADQGDQSQGDPSQGDQPGADGGKSGQGGLQGRQKALRQKLGQLQKQMRDMGLDGEKGFDAAGQAMKEAENALGEGSDGTDRAVEAQGRALRALQQGAQGLAKQMAQGQQGDGEGQQDSEEGEGQDDGTGDRTGMDSDPLGRPRATHGTSGRDLELGQGLAARAQQVLEELRRRLGDPSRPQEEQDYLERLLKHY